MYCQIVYLRGCLPGRIRHALAELPKTLDNTYERTLGDINEANWEFAHRMFQCVSVASRPLQVEELADFLAFDFKAGQIPQFHQNWCLEDPAYAVLSTCSSLLTIVDVEGAPVIQFSHFSVKEFLTSTRLAETSNIITRRYHISLVSAHTLAAQACLGILLHLDMNITRHSLQRFRLAEYASKHWVDHARFENVLPSAEHGMKRLFDPDKPHLSVWVWIYDPANSWHTRERGIMPSDLSGTALHYAAFCGLHTIVKYLIVEHSLDVNARGLYKKSTPLHWASSKGHMDTVRILLEHEADVSAQNDDGSTPLHWAARRGRVEVVHILLEHGADATAQDKNKLTPLHQASSGGHVDSVRVFLEYGVDATAQDKNGWTALHCASYEGHVEVTSILLDHGVDATVLDKDGRTPLHRASFEGHVEVTRVFLEHGVDATAQDKDGRTLLHRASFEGHVKVVRILLEHGVDATAQDKNGWTPLHHASQEGHPGVARVLLQRGADATAQDKDGWTPLNLAIHQGHNEVTCILLEHCEGRTQSGPASVTNGSPSVNTSHERQFRRRRSKSAMRVKEDVYREVQVSDFEVMRILSKGRAGKVLLVRHKSSLGLYALKAINKQHVLALQNFRPTLTEQAVLCRVTEEGTNPFVVKLWSSFHNEGNLFLVMVRAYIVSRCLVLT